MTDASPRSASTSRAPDGYTVADAARILGVSPSRVRQLAHAGTLTSTPKDGRKGAPLILDRESVHRERKVRKTSRKETPKPDGISTTGGLSTAELMDIFERMQERTMETLRRERTEMLAIRDRTEEDLRNALAAERVAREMAERHAGTVASEVEQLREEASRLRAEVEELKSQPSQAPVVTQPPVARGKRRWWWQSPAAPASAAPTEPAVVMTPTPSEWAPLSSK